MDVYKLWDELAASPASHIDDACRHLMATVSGWLGADNAGWIGTVRLLHGDHTKRDALSGWRTRVITFLHPPDATETAAAAEVLAHSGRDPGMSAIATARLSGTFRVHRLRDGFVDFDRFRRTPHYHALYKGFGVDDRLWVGSPIGSGAESFFVFDKRRTSSRFTKADAELAAFTFRGLTWFQRQLLCSHGLLVAQSPLTPTERRVVQMLLTDKPEKEIAAALNQRPGTTHDHVKEIYRKFNVKGRAGLTAIWLSHR